MTELLASSGGEAEFNVLGVPLGEFIIGTIAFLIVFGFLGKVLLPKIKQALQDREDAIEGGLRKAEEAQAESAKLKEQYTDQLASAREEASAIRTAAQGEKARIIDEARGEAQEAQNAVIANAQAQIEAEKARASSDLRQSVGVLATELASRIVGESLTDDAKAAAVVDRFISDLEQTASATPGQA